jgi:hypothetical protein
MRRWHLYLAFSVALLIAALLLGRLSPRLQAQTPLITATPIPALASVHPPAAAADVSPTSQPSTAGSSAHPPSLVPGGPGAMHPCDRIGPYDSTQPPHPYQLGDPVCDGRGHSVAHPEYHQLHPIQPGSRPARQAGATSFPPANWDSGYPNEWAEGADATVETTAQYASRLVTQPNFGSGTDFLYSTMHEGTPGNWTEIGWMWGAGQPAPAIFTSSEDVNSVPQVDPRFSIGPNAILSFEIVSYGNNAWGNYLYWPAAGGWVLVSSYTLNAYYTSDSNVDYEFWTDYNGQFLNLSPTSIYSTQIYWCPSSCGWYNLDTSVPTATFFIAAPGGGSSPYYIQYTDPFYYWEAYGG